MPAKKSKPRTEFLHQRLSFPRSIRLLTLLPSLAVQASLEVTLTEVTLDSISNFKDAYEALSYVWGSRFGTEPIRCNNQILLVTRSCRSALQHLRQTDATRTLWIDAICIDQDENAASVKERNEQVALMGEIYAKATRTLCWFGEGNDFSEELVKFLNQIGTCPSQRGLKKFLLFDERLRKDGRVGADSSALNYIFCHPWHSRIWTVQEAAYSQDCYIVCGNSTIPWSIYSAAARLLVNEAFIEELDPEAHKSYIGIDVRNVLRGFLREAPSTSTDTEDIEDERDRRVVFLTSTLSEVNQLRATDLRDKIYGLHALYTGLGIPLPAVNYESSISRVYEEATVSMIAWSGTLKVLADACHSSRDRTFPSWVPDWSAGSLKISVPSGDSTGGSKITELPENLNPRSGELHIHGKMVGMVIPWAKSLSPIAGFPTHSERCEVPILTQKLEGLVDDVETVRLWIEKIRHFRHLYALLQTDGVIYQGDPDDTFYDLLNQSSYSEPHEISLSWLEILQYPKTKYDLTHAEILVEKWKQADQSATGRWTVELTNCAVIVATLLFHLARYDGRELPHAPAILDLMIRFSGNLGDKTLILTHLSLSGRTALGTGVHTVAAGDSVVLLQGADWPVVLRPIDGRWRFLGPAFVSGIMDGEAWSDESSQIEGMKEFVLI